MARYITINKADLNEALVLIQNGAAVIRIGSEAYEWLKKQLHTKQVGHTDQQANHHSHLPHQGGFVSFYVDPNGTWMQITH